MAKEIIQGKKPFLDYVNGPKPIPKKKSKIKIEKIKETPQGTKLKFGVKVSGEF
jgi:ribosomal protein S10